jgi:Zn-dependent M28 family amino/carboxypeptidase
VKICLQILFVLFCLSSNPAQAAKINPDRLERHVQVLSAGAMAGRRTGTAGSVLAQHYIVSAFAELKLTAFKDDYRHAFDFGAWLSEQQGVNLVGWVPGTERPEDYIVVSAHYDHLGRKGSQIFYGADDNASGVAALLMIAENVAAAPLRHSIIFLASDAEEFGLYGARAFTDKPPVPLDRIRLNMNLDMLGIGDQRNRLYIGGGRGNKALSRAIDSVEMQEPFQLLAGYPRQPRGFGTGRRINYRNASDHGAFARHGIDFLFITTGDHAYYHTGDDRFEQLNMELFGRATQAVWSLLKHVDSNLSTQK